MKVRIGIDVGGTFTDAVAINNDTYELIGSVKAPTTHSAKEGVAAGIVQVLHQVMEQYNIAPEDVNFIAHGTTQATNALLEGDVAKVGVVTLGQGLEGAKSKSDTTIGSIELAPKKYLESENAYVETTAADLDEAIRKALEELKGKKIGYAAGTSSESILTTALASVGLTMDDVDALSMDATALTTAALSGQVDAVAAWSPMSLTILAQAENATDICSNVDFATMASPGSWVVNPDWAAENADVIVRFNRAMFKAMDFASAATSDDAVAQEVAGYVAAITGLDVESTIAQRYDGSWLTSAQVLEMIESGKLVEYYNNQQVNFGDAAGPLKADEFVLVDLMVNAK